MTSHFQKFFRTYGFEVSLFTINDISVISLVKESYRGKIDKKKPIEGFYTGGGRGDTKEELMTYINWMKKTYGKEDSPKGDLARDIRTDGSFPKNGVGKFDGWRRLIRSYLVSRSACNGCLAAFDESWKEYEACERRRLNRPLSGR